MEQKRLGTIGALWYRIVKGVMRLAFFLLSHLEVVGRENIPDERPMIITINHISAVDLAAILVTFPYPATAFAADRYRAGFYGLILRPFNPIFVRRGAADRHALRQALEYLKGGGILGLAPEGTRSRTRQLIRAKPGAAFLAVRTDATILPIGLSGTETVLQEWKRFRRPRIRVNIGKPYKLDARKEGRQDLQALSDEMMLRIAELLPKAYHGVYANWERTKAD